MHVKYDINEGTNICVAGQEALLQKSRLNLRIKCLENSFKKSFSDLNRFFYVNSIFNMYLLVI